jgi:hypothetical protein
MATLPEDLYGMTNLPEQCPTTSTFREFLAPMNPETFSMTQTRGLTSLLIGLPIQ